MENQIIKDIEKEIGFSYNNLKLAKGDERLSLVIVDELIKKISKLNKKLKEFNFSY